MLGWFAKGVAASTLSKDLHLITRALAARGPDAELVVARHVMKVATAASMYMQDLTPAHRDRLHRESMTKASAWRRDAMDAAIAHGLDPFGDPEWAAASLVESWHMSQVIGPKAASAGNRIVEWANRVLGSVETKRVIDHTWAELRACGAI